MSQRRTPVKLTSSSGTTTARARRVRSSCSGPRSRGERRDFRGTSTPSSGGDSRGHSGGSSSVGAGGPARSLLMASRPRAMWAKSCRIGGCSWFRRCSSAAMLSRSCRSICCISDGKASSAAGPLRGRALPVGHCACPLPAERPLELEAVSDSDDSSSRPSSTPSRPGLWSLGPVRWRCISMSRRCRRAWAWQARRPLSSALCSCTLRCQLR
mmetsp:Transcript_19725/g.35125  ORF Transcript_19725/g.35125 Transcript_19725/m.35125 type:complete len:212 (+) Transcript_19725:376-1011(+)